jgi:hypothetical protein
VIRIFDFTHLARWQSIVRLSPRPSSAQRAFVTATAHGRWNAEHRLGRFGLGPHPRPLLSPHSSSEALCA